MRRFFTRRPTPAVQPEPMEPEMNASPIQAAAAVAANRDVDTRIKACRAIMREAVKMCAQIGAGCTVEGVEEIEFGDRAQGALLDYLKSRQNPERGREYIGATRGLDKILAEAREHIQAAQQTDQMETDNAAAAALGDRSQPDEGRAASAAESAVASELKAA